MVERASNAQQSTRSANKIHIADKLQRSNDLLQGHVNIIWSSKPDSCVQHGLDLGYDQLTLSERCSGAYKNSLYFIVSCSKKSGNGYYDKIYRHHKLNLQIEYFNRISKLDIKNYSAEVESNVNGVVIVSFKTLFEASLRDVRVIVKNKVYSIFNKDKIHLPNELCDEM